MHHKHHGFSLIETMLGMAIIAAIITAIFITYSLIFNHIKANQDAEDIKELLNIVQGHTASQINYSQISLLGLPTMDSEIRNRIHRYQGNTAPVYTNQYGGVFSSTVSGSDGNPANADLFTLTSTQNTSESCLTILSQMHGLYSASVNGVAIPFSKPDLTDLRILNLNNECSKSNTNTISMQILKINPIELFQMEPRPSVYPDPYSQLPTQSWIILEQNRMNKAISLRNLLQSTIP